MSFVSFSLRSSIISILWFDSSFLYTYDWYQYVVIVFYIMVTTWKVSNIIDYDNAIETSRKYVCDISIVYRRFYGPYRTWKNSLSLRRQWSSIMVQLTLYNWPLVCPSWISFYWDIITVGTSILLANLHHRYWSFDIPMIEIPISILWPIYVYRVFLLLLNILM